MLGRTTMNPEFVVVYGLKDGMSYRAQVLQRTPDGVRVRLVGVLSEPFIVNTADKEATSGYVLKQPDQPFTIVRCELCHSGSSDDKLVFHGCPKCKMAIHQSCEEKANNGLPMPQFEMCLSCFVEDSDDEEG